METAEPSFWFRLDDCGPHRVRVVKLVSECCGLSLYETGRAVKELPWLILSESGPMSRSDAMRIIRPLAEGLEALGAKFEWDFDYGDYE